MSRPHHLRDLDAAEILNFKRRMEDLDQQHARARSPEQRMRVEIKMRELREELARMEQLKKKVDAAAEEWWAETKRRLKEVLG